MVLRKYKIIHYSQFNSKDYNIGLFDENGLRQGESVSYKTNGSIWYKAFCKNEYFIGKVEDYEEGTVRYRYYSFINLGKNISEHEYKKELAMVRLGLIEMPELSYFLKDYELESVITIE